MAGSIDNGRDSSGLKTILNQLDLFGYDELSAAILTAFLSDTPLLLTGVPGTAKTTIALRLAKVMQKTSIVMDVPHITIERLLGIPNPFAMEKDKSLEYVGGLVALKPELVVLDELTRGNPIIQSYIIELVRERRINNVHLGCAIIAAANPPSTTLQNINYLDMALASRFCTFELPKPTADILNQIAEGVTVEKDNYPLSLDLKSLFSAPVTFPDQVRGLAKQLIPQFKSYGINGRQIFNLLSILAKALELEQLGIHDYSRFDIGYLVASLIPCKVVRSNELQNTSFYEVAANIARVLPEQPFKNNKSALGDPTSLAGEIDRMLADIQSQSLKSLIQIARGTTPARAAAISEINRRMLQVHNLEVKNIVIDKSWLSKLLELAEKHPETSNF